MEHWRPHALEKERRVFTEKDASWHRDQSYESVCCIFMYIKTQYI